MLRGAKSITEFHNKNFQVDMRSGCIVRYIIFQSLMWVELLIPLLCLIVFIADNVKVYVTVVDVKFDLLRWNMSLIKILKYRMQDHYITLHDENRSY